MVTDNPVRQKNVFKGEGFEGEKTEIFLENYTAYNSKVVTEQEVEFQVSGAENWLQFHYQLSGRTNTFIVTEARNVVIEPNTFTVLYQKKGSCHIQFPANCLYESFGFRVDPGFFTSSFLTDFSELAGIQDAILEQKLFYLDKKYSGLDIKTREIITSIIHNPYDGTMEEAFIENKIVELIFYSIPALKKNAEKGIGNKTR